MALTDVLRRIKWLKYLFPSQRDLQYEQGFWNTKRQRHVAYDHVAGVSNGLEVTEKAPASLVVSIAAGRATDASGDDDLIASAQDLDLTSFVPGGGTQTVYIVIYYATTETDPYVVPELGTSQNRYYRESPVIRGQLAAPSGDEIEIARIEIAAAAAALSDAANPDYPGNNEIDMRYRKYSNTRGLSLQVSTGDDETPLSAVTVGETNCDFRDLPAAIHYVTTHLTRSVTRQVTILMFEKEDGEAWQPGAVFTIPKYTHLIGMGKPTLIFTGVAGTLITLDQEASLKNFHIDVDDSWTKVISLAGRESVVDNVDIRFEDANSITNYAWYSEPGVSKWRISNCRLLPYSGDSTKGCYGIYVDDGSEFVIENCHLLGPSNLLMSTAGSYQGQINNVRFHSTSSAGPSMGGYIQGFEHVVSNLVASVTAGNTVGFRLESPSTNIVASNIVVRVSSTSDDIFALYLEHVTLTGFDVYGGRVQVIDFCSVSDGRILSDYAGTAVLVDGKHNRLLGLHIDRDSANQPCIEPGTDADENIVANCILDNTGSSPSIQNNQAGSTDWLLTGNMVDVATPVGKGWDIVGEKVI